MTSSEARRHHLYNSLRDLIGPDQADTLMAHLPTSEFPDLATREDIATLRSDNEARFERVEERFDRVEDRFERIDARFDQIDARFERVEDRFERVEDRFVALGEQLDRIVLSLVAGLVAIIAAFIAQSLF